MRKKRKGVIAIAGIFLILIMLGVLSYIYELGRLTVAKIKLQNAADAAAAAGAAVFANVRNNATVDYALMKMYKDAAENAAKWQYFIAATGLQNAYYEREWKPRDERNIRVSGVLSRILRINRGWQLMKMYHRAFRVQDGMVTRFLAVYEDHIFKFWRIYRDTLGGNTNYSNVHTYMSEFAKRVGLYNICYVPERLEVIGGRIRFWNPYCSSGLFGRRASKNFPFFSYERVGIRNSTWEKINYKEEFKLSRLDRVASYVIGALAFLPTTNFVGMDWIRRWNRPPRFWGTLGPTIQATAAARQQEFNVGRINFFELFDWRVVRSINASKLVFLTDPTRFSLPHADGLRWYRPRIMPAIADHRPENPHH